MSFFDDLTRSSSDFMGDDFDLTSNPLAASIKSNKKCCDTKATLEMNINVTQKDGKATGTSQNVAFKTKGANGCSTKVKVDAKSAKYEKEFNVVKDDDKTIGLKFVGASKQDKNQFNWTSELKASFPNLVSGTALANTFAVTCGTDKKLTGVYTGAVTHDDLQAGVKVTGDLKAKAVTGFESALTYKLSDEVSTFATFDQTKKALQIGSLFAVPSFEKVGAIASLDLNRDDKGALGPKTFAVVAEKKLADHSTIRVRTDIADSIEVTGAFVHKINDNFTLRATDKISPLKAFKSGNLETYTAGVSLDFEF